MGWRPRLLFCLFLSLTLAAAARAATVHQEWEISYQFKSPDCVRKLAVTINGQTPGMPDAEPFSYDGEHDVLRNYCWHKSTDEQATGLASVPLVWVGEPQSLLIIGRGRFVNCSAMAAGACNATHPERATPVFAVVPGKTYRFRIASITSLLALNFEIEGQLSSFLLGFLAFGTAIMAGILNAGFERVLGGWSRGPKVVYKVSTWLATVFLGLAAVFMVAWYRASSMTRNRKLLSISEFCAKLGVILSINLLVVIFPCRLGRGACVAAIPAVAVITFLIATVRLWGRVIILILGRPRRQTQLAGDGMT